MWHQLKAVAWGTAHVEPTQVTWRAPLRAAIVTTALGIVAILLDHDASAIPLALGALLVGIADTIENPAQRMRSMLWTTVWISLGGLVGGLISDDRAVDVVFLGLLGVVCGFAGALGRLGGLAGLLTLVIACISTGVPESKVSAVQFGILVLAGGLIQTAVTVVPDLIRHRDQILARLPAKPRVAQRLREHMNPNDPMFRHAIRLGCAITVAAIIADFIHWPHSYWIPLTVAWLSKPNREGTGSRVLARVLGTVVGIGLAVLVVDVLHLKHFGLALLVGVGAFVTIAFLAANYAIAVAGISMVVMALFTLIGDPVGQTAVARIAATVVGAVIVIIAPLIYPPPKPATSAA